MLSLSLRLGALLVLFLVCSAGSCCPTCPIRTEVQVVDGDGNPIAGATVRETNTEACCGAGDCVRTTGPAGRAVFAFSDIMSVAACRIEVEKPGFVSAAQDYGVACDDSARSVNHALTVVLVAQ